jgi:hypothetical protein
LSTSLFESAHVASYQRFFLFTTPAFQLLFAANGGRQRIKRFRIDKRNGTTSGGVLRGGAIVVSFLTGSQVVGVADIEGIVATAEDYKRKAYEVPLDSLRSLGTPFATGPAWPAMSEAQRAESNGAEAGI